MLSKLAILGAALIAAAPVWAANSGGAASSAVTAVSGAGGHGGGSAGGGGEGHSGGGLGAHSAAASTHLGGAGHTLHAATAHALTAHASDSKRVALLNEAAKKPDHGHGHDHASHLFLHRGSAYSQLDWASVCLLTFTAADGRWSDCNRPAKTNPAPRT